MCDEAVLELLELCLSLTLGEETPFGYTKEDLEELLDELYKEVEERDLGNVSVFVED